MGATDSLKSYNEVEPISTSELIMELNFPFKHIGDGVNYKMDS